MTLEALNNKLAQNPAIESFFHQDRPERRLANFRNKSLHTDLQQIISDYRIPAEVREYSIAIVLPIAIDGVEPIQQLRAASTLMDWMNELFDGVSLFPHLSQYNSSVVRGYCQQELLVKSWTTRQTLLDRFEEVIERVADIGEALHQQKMTLLIEVSGDRLTVRLQTSLRS